MLSAVGLFLANGQTLAQSERELDDIQRYGAPWRYNHRDWSGVHGAYLSPGVCWYWNNRCTEWVLGC